MKLRSRFHAPRKARATWMQDVSWWPHDKYGSASDAIKATLHYTYIKLLHCVISRSFQSRQVYWLHRTNFCFRNKPPSHAHNLLRIVRFELEALEASLQKVRNYRDINLCTRVQWSLISSILNIKSSVQRSPCNCMSKRWATSSQYKPSQLAFGLHKITEHARIRIRLDPKRGVICNSEQRKESQFCRIARILYLFCFNVKAKTV